MLANIFLHTVLDEWFHREVVPRLAGQARLIRFADDGVFLFADQADARRVLEVLPKRFAKYGLTLHPDKTRLVEFQRPDQRTRDDDRKGPGTFDLLGFTHFWGKSRADKWVVKRKTATDRLQRALARVADWCRSHRHDAVRAQQQALARKVRGHFEYYGITGNIEMLVRFRREVVRIWCKWLRRRSQQKRPVWDRMNALLERLPLPPARITHPLARRPANP